MPEKSKIKGKQHEREFSFLDTHEFIIITEINSFHTYFIRLLCIYMEKVLFILDNRPKFSFTIYTFFSFPLASIAVSTPKIRLVVKD